MKASTCIAVVTAMVIEGAVIAAFWPSTTSAQIAHVSEKPEAKAPDHSAETIKALRSHIAALEKKLAEKSEAPVAEKIEETEEPRAPEPRSEEAGPREWRRPTLADMRSWGENMKKNDPEGYARMTNHFARARERRAAENAFAKDFLSSVNTETMSAQALKTHSEYIALRDRSAQLEQEIEAVHQDADATDEQLASLMQEMGETQRKLWEVARDERDVLLVQTAEALGYSGDDADEIVTTIKEIFSTTGGGGRRGPGGPGGRPGGPRR